MAESVPVFDDLLGLSASLFASWFTFGLPGLFWLSLNVERKGWWCVKKGRWGWSKWLLLGLNLGLVVAGAVVVSLIKPVIRPANQTWGLPCHPILNANISRSVALACIRVSRVSRRARIRTSLSHVRPSRKERNCERELQAILSAQYFEHYRPNARLLEAHKRLSALELTIVQCQEYGIQMVGYSRLQQ